MGLWRAKLVFFGDFEHFPTVARNDVAENRELSVLSDHVRVLLLIPDLGCTKSEKCGYFQVALTCLIFGVGKFSWALGLCTPRDLLISGDFFLEFSNTGYTH